MDPVLANKVWAAKERARRNQSIRAWTLLITFCVVFGSFCIATVMDWTLIEDRHHPSLIIVVGLVYSWCIRLLKKAKCPICAIGWEIAEGYHSPPELVMTKWKYCPGCSTPMDDLTLKRARGLTQQAQPDLAM